MHMKTNESKFLEKLDRKSAKSGQVLRRYVVANLAFLQACVAQGYTLTAISEVISEELQHKVYPSNLGRLLSKFSPKECQQVVLSDITTENVAVVKSSEPSSVDPDIFSIKGKTVRDDKLKSKDPFGIGGLM